MKRITNATDAILNGMSIREVIESQSGKKHITEATQKITLGQFLDVYDCDMNGTVEVHGNHGILFKLPLEDNDILDVSEFLVRPVHRIDKYKDMLIVYI